MGAFRALRRPSRLAQRWLSFWKLGQAWVGLLLLERWAQTDNAETPLLLPKPLEQTRRRCFWRRVVCLKKRLRTSQPCSPDVPTGCGTLPLNLALMQFFDTAGGEAGTSSDLLSPAPVLGFEFPAMTFGGLQRLPGSD